VSFVFCVLCFASYAFMEEGEYGRLVYPNLENELASYVILVFVLHDVLWECGSNWWIGLWKDDEL